MEKSELINVIIFGIFALALIGFDVYSFSIGSRYKWDGIFLMLFLIVIFLFRKRFKLYPVHFLLFGCFLIIHNLGVFGLYRNFYFGIEYDIFVHFFFGLVASLILFRGFGISKHRAFGLVVILIGLILGMAAFHELFEAAGALILGEGEGVLFMGAGDIDEWDTHKDMLMNLIGGIVGVSGYWIYGLLAGLIERKIKKRKRELEQKENPVLGYKPKGEEDESEEDEDSEEENEDEEEE